MKNFRFFAILMALLLCCGMQAQVTTEPTPLNEDDTDVVIYFHANQGSKGLANTPASTPLYAHTGVITSQSKNDSDWKFATPTWGDNSEKYQLSYVEPNLWKLYIGNIREYYGINDPNISIKKLAFVFRNADCSKTGKATGDKDIMVDVLNDALEISLSYQPNTTLFNTLPYTVDFTVGTTKEADITLSCKGETFGSVTNATELTASYTFTEPGNHIVTVTAVAGDKKATFARSFTYVEPSPAGVYPGGIPVMGPVANADGSVTFCLAAPEKSSVMLVGEWDDYDVEANDLMQRQDYEGQRYFFKTIPNIDPTRSYGYYFIVDTQTKVGDPYARLVLDPANDQYITDVVYPDMPKYPNGKVSNVPLAVWKGNINEYDWQVTDFEAAPTSDLIIYELLLRDFTGTDGKARGNGTVRQAIDRIPYLKELGINAVELLPINEFNGNNSWGYNPNFYFAPDKAYGTPDDYKEFIDKCHAEGIAVILDMVFNQTDWQHPWYRLYPVGSNPFYNPDAPHAYSVLNDWNQGHPLVKQQWKDVVRYWMTEYKVDGFRFDLVKGLGDNDSYDNNGDAATNAYNASRVANMRLIQEAMLEVNDKCIFINENLAGSKEENEMAAYGQLNWANVNNSGCQYAMGFSSDSGLQRMYALNDSRTWGSTVSYLESHDEQRLAYKQEKWGVPALKNNHRMAMNRLASCAAQMILSPGAHMIWQFSEMGNAQNTKNDDGGNNTDPKVVSWYLLGNHDNYELMQNYRQLIYIRRNNPALFTEEAEFTSKVKATNWKDGRVMHSKSGNSEIITVLNPNTTEGESITVNIEFMNKNNADYQILSVSDGTKYDFSAANGTVTVESNGYVVIGTKDLSAVKEFASESAGTLNVITGPGEIIIPENNAPVNIYGIDGTLRHRDVTGRVTVEAGMYIVRCGRDSAKVIVR